MAGLKRIWWSFCAAAQGVPLEVYIDKKLRNLHLKLAELPETPNYLTSIREYYGLKSRRRSWEVLQLTMALSIPGLMIIILLPNRAYLGIGLLAGLWVSQVSLVAVGVVIARRYPSKSEE